MATIGLVFPDEETKTNEQKFEQNDAKVETGYICDVCGKVCKTAPALKSHKRAHNKGE